MGKVLTNSEEVPSFYDEVSMISSFSELSGRAREGGFNPNAINLECF